MRIWLHIGGEKTGSTSIQHGFAKSREPLKAQGVLYPRALGERSHLKLYCFASEGPTDELKGQLGLRGETEIANFRQSVERELHAEVERSKPEILVVSNEHCSSRLFKPSEVERVHQLFSPMSPDIKVVFYARPQWELLTSAYSTHVKEGGTEPFGMPATEELDAKYNYRRILELWASVFGGENIMVRRYSADTLTSGDVVADFCKLAGVPLVIDDLPRRNPGLSVPALEFLRRFNRLVPRTVEYQFNPLRGNIAHLLERYRPEQKLVADSALIGRICEWSAPINAWVSDHFLGGAPLFPAPEITPLPPASAENFTLEQAFHIFAYLWQLKQKQILNSKR